MRKLHDYIISEVSRDCTIFYWDEYEMYMVYFPKLNRVFMECEDHTEWMEADGFQDAMHKYLSFSKQELREYC